MDDATAPSHRLHPDPLAGDRAGDGEHPALVVLGDSVAAPPEPVRSQLGFGLGTRCMSDHPLHSDGKSPDRLIVDEAERAGGSRSNVGALEEIRRPVSSGGRPVRRQG